MTEFYRKRCEAVKKRLPTPFLAPERQGLRWASFHNSESFWVKREDLIGLIYDLGFKTVFEQFDYHAPDITKVLTESYEYLLRGRFVGIR
mgnify:FL=1